jgi:hypothetical protein
MESKTQEGKWSDETAKEVAKIAPVLSPLGYEIYKEQPHISGERYLMTKNKLVLIGKNIENNMEVVIKISDEESGKNEIKQEKEARDYLTLLPFSQDNILFPKEIFYGEKSPYLIWVSEFIAQEKVFVNHTIEEQFFTILRAFEAQESFHATTSEHLRKVEKVFKVLTASDYIKNFEVFTMAVERMHNNADLHTSMYNALEFLRKNSEVIDDYCNYLNHTDFVPHNFRVRERSVYMLDCSSVYFGNKYEGWARFLNYMLIHNPELEALLAEYVFRNRGEREYFSLRLMRIYKVGFLLNYYAEALGKTDGDLHALTLKRIDFWNQVLEALMADKPLGKEILPAYLEARDALRSREEKKRQREFAVA